MSEIEDEQVPPLTLDEFLVRGALFSKADTKSILLSAQERLEDGLWDIDGDVSKCSPSDVLREVKKVIYGFLCASVDAAEERW